MTYLLFYQTNCLKGETEMSSIEQLAKVVLEKSESKNWDIAIKEWDLVDTSEDVTVSSICVCGKPGIRYLHRITNLFNVL